MRSGEHVSHDHGPPVPLLTNKWPLPLSFRMACMCTSAVALIGVASRPINAVKTITQKAENSLFRARQMSNLGFTVLSLETAVHCRTRRGRLFAARRASRLS